MKDFPKDKEKIMTRIVPSKCKCAVCGAKSRYNVIASTNTFGGGPDLDLRPPEMERSTMPYLP